MFAVVCGMGTRVIVWFWRGGGDGRRRSRVDKFDFDGRAWNEVGFVLAGYR